MDTGAKNKSREKMPFSQGSAITQHKHKSIDDKTITKCHMNPKVGAPVIDILIVDRKKPARVKTNKRKYCISSDQNKQFIG